MDELAVFCRSNHPAGYGGFPDTIHGPAPEQRDQKYSGAHGYVTLIVLCRDGDELNDVTQRLDRYFQWKGRRDTWYSGRFDLVWSAPALIDPFQAKRKWPSGAFDIGSWVSYGDNRACAYLTGAEVLSADG